jgi:proteic killer suppression protein
VEISYRTKKLEKLASNSKERLRKLGKQRADRFEKRISELKAATCLEDLRHMPQARIHQLKGDRSHQFSADLDQPYRLIFTPTNDPEPRLDDGGWNWSEITIISIIEITNTHE